MHVDHRDRVEHVLLDQSPEGDDDTELGRDGQDVVDVVADRDPELEGERLDRAGRGGAAATAAPVRLRDDEHDVVSRLVQRPQWSDRDLGRTEVDEMPFARRVRHRPYRT